LSKPLENLIEQQTIHKPEPQGHPFEESPSSKNRKPRHINHGGGKVVIEYRRKRSPQESVDG
jgi:hypothetical protein